MKAVAAMRNQFGGHAVQTEAPAGGDVEGKQGSEQPPAQAPAAKEAGAGSGEEPGES